jgi:hypothetical protein
MCVWQASRRLSLDFEKDLRKFMVSAEGDGIIIIITIIIITTSTRTPNGLVLHTKALWSDRVRVRSVNVPAWKGQE